MGAAAPKRQLNSAAPRQYKDTTRTRYNAIRHGILARSVVLEGEDIQQYEDLRTALARDLEVVGMVEEMWLDQLVSCYWRQQRILRAEAQPDAKLEVLHRYEVGLRNEIKSIMVEIREVQRLRHERYFAATTNPGRRHECAEAADRHERRFWGTVQDEFEGPQPAPESVAAPPPAAPPPAAPAPAPPRPVTSTVPELPTDVPVTDAAVRFAIESRSEYAPVRPGNPPTVRAFVADRSGLMSRNEGV